MLSEVRKALENELAYQKEAEISCQSIIDGYTNFIFLNRNGCPHNPQTINRAIKRVTLAYNEEEMERAEKEKREPMCMQRLRRMPRPSHLPPWKEK